MLKAASVLHFTRDQEEWARQQGAYYQGFTQRFAVRDPERPVHPQHPFAVWKPRNWTNSCPWQKLASKEPCQFCLEPAHWKQSCPGSQRTPLDLGIRSWRKLLVNPLWSVSIHSKRSRAQYTPMSQWHCSLFLPHHAITFKLGIWLTQKSYREKD